MRGGECNPWGVICTLYVCISSFISGEGGLCAVLVVGGWLVIIEGSRVRDFIQFLECNREFDYDDDAVFCLYASPVVGWWIWC